jgi:hypothetical protein
MVILLVLAAATAQPSQESLRLGRELAESGTLATLLPLVQQKESEELVASHPELSAGEKAKLRATAKRVYESGRDRMMESEARAFAKRLSVADLRVLVAFQRSAAAKRYRANTPEVIAAMMQALGTMDYKGDVLAAYCKETGKLCGK